MIVKNSKDPKIGIIIPAYNEASVISQVIVDVSKVFEATNSIIVVVDDGSSDNTLTELKKHPEVITIPHIMNMGAGAATRTGIIFAKQNNCDYVVTIDADGQHKAEDAKKLIKAIQDGDEDMVIGSRLIDTKGMPWYRIFGNKALNVITFMLFGVFVSDSQSGMKALNRKALLRLNFYSNNYAFCSEMIWQAKRAGLKIEEVAISAIYTEYSLAKGQSNMDVIHILKQLFKHRIMDLING